MKRIIIKYNPERCVGALECIRYAPSYFSFDGEKAVLKKSLIKDNFPVLEVEVSAENLSLIKKAAESCPVNAIGVFDRDQQKIIISTELTEDKPRLIKAEYDDAREFVLDPQGYFLIRINKQDRTIELALCKKLNQISVKIIGEKPLEIYHTIIREKLISRLDHAAYLGKELQKAFLALQNNLEYVQDEELKIK